MIDGLKPYPAMKDSGVPWLDKVPKHWGVRRISSVADMRVSNVDKHTKETELPVRLCNYVNVYRNGKITDRIPFMRATATSEEIERFHVQIGDVLITKDSETWNDIGVPSLVEYAPADLVCGYHLALFRPRKPLAIGAYLHRALQSPGVAYQFHIAANGVTRYGLSHNSIGSVQLPLPPVSEQADIARFLDHMDRRIRKYIRAKQELVRLLEEQKQVIVHRSVTRGLDANVQLKPSGVEWLGDVPHRWRIWQLGHFSRIGNGSTPSRGNADYWSAGFYPWLNSSRVNRSPITTANQFVTDRALKECHLPIVTPGSLLIAITGQGKTRGTSAILGMEATINQHIAYITPRAGFVVPDFLHSVLIGAYLELRRISDDSGSTKGALTCDAVSHFKIPIPPLDEQHQIVTHILKETRTANAAISQAERETGLLREYRTRLFSDVVTGKLDVREAATHLPDEVEKSEPLEETDASPDADDLASEDLDATSEEAHD